MERRGAGRWSSRLPLLPSGSAPRHQDDASLPRLHRAGNGGAWQFSRLLVRVIGESDVSIVGPWLTRSLVQASRPPSVLQQGLRRFAKQTSTERDERVCNVFRGKRRPPQPQQQYRQHSRLQPGCSSLHCSDRCSAPRLGCKSAFPLPRFAVLDTPFQCNGCLLPVAERVTAVDR